MNNFEIWGFVIGCVGLLCTGFHVDTSDATNKQTVFECLVAIIIYLIFGAMVLLPLYFNFWKK